MKSAQKLYVLVRNDIPIADQIVQACHVVETWRNIEKRNPMNAIVVLSVSDRTALFTWQRKMDQRAINWTSFRESDMNNEMTAIACLTDTNIFSGLKLWQQ